MLYLSWSFTPILCWLGTHLVSLGRTPVLWWYCPRFTTGRGVFLSATVSLPRYWHHSYVYVMSGTTCLLSVCGRCRGVAIIVSSRTWCLPSAGCVFLFSHLGVVDYPHDIVPKKMDLVMSWNINLLGWEWCFLLMWITRLDGMAFWFLVGGSTDL